MTAAALRCRICGTVVAGRYCQGCGQPTADVRRTQAIYTLFVPLIALAYGWTMGLLHRRRKPWLVPLVAGIQYLCFVYLLLAVFWTVTRAAGADPFRISPIHILRRSGRSPSSSSVR